MARDHAAEYSNLTGRLAELRQRHAVLVAREEDKTRSRVGLEEELTAAGVDVSDLEGEEARLTREVDDALAAAALELDDFEQKLQAAEAPGTTAGAIVELT